MVRATHEDTTLIKKTQSLNSKKTFFLINIVFFGRLQKTCYKRQNKAKIDPDLSQKMR